MHADREYSVCDMACMIKFYKGEIKPDIVITPDLEEMVKLGMNPKEYDLHKENIELAKQLAKTNERVKELENSFKQSIPIVDTLYALARNQLWIAYVWNDHNFPLNPEKYAKEAAESMGITNVDDANKLVEAFKQLRKEQDDEV
jgi:hypothetical protein